MANKAIKQYNETTATQTGSATADKDALLLQRGSNYFWIDPVAARLGIQKAELTMTAAEVKALNSTPLEIVAAQGAGTYIIPLSGTYIVREAGTAYATQTTLRGKFNGAAEADYFYTWNSVLAGTSKLLKIADYANADNEDVLENTAFEIYAPTSDPTTGTGSVTVVMYYRVIEA